MNDVRVYLLSGLLGISAGLSQRSVMAFALIPQGALDSVVAIGSSQSGRNSWSGTGFLYGDFRETVSATQGAYSIYIVTNRHVIEGIQKTGVCETLIRFSPNASGQVIEYKQPLEKWFYGPPTAPDIAITPFQTPEETRGRFSSFDAILSNSQVADLARMRTLGVTEGDGVFILGFPIGVFTGPLAATLFPGDRHFPFARRGSIARIRDTLAGITPEFLVDGLVFPGNSGGPVVLQVESSALQGTQQHQQAFVIGVVSAYLPYSDVAFSPQTGRPRVSFDENSGLTVVIPMDAVRTVIGLRVSTK